MTEKNPASCLPGDVERQETLRRARERHQKKAEKNPPIEGQTVGDAKKKRQIQGNSVVLNAWQDAKSQALLVPPNVETHSSSTSLGAALREFTLERENNRPLRFTGHLIGWNQADPENEPRGTQVQIFVTRSNKIVIAVYQWQHKEDLARERHKAWVVTSPEEAFESLIEDGGGKLGRASREAWDRACSTWPSFRGHEVEVID